MKKNIQVQTVKESRLKDVDFDNIPFGRTFSDHMFISEYQDGEWVNPRIVPFESFQIHPASMVLHYGQAIFEGMKATKSIDGQPLFFRPEEHVTRINASARRMCMPEVPGDMFMDAIHQLVALDKGWIPPKTGSALYVRPYMFANDEFIGVAPAENYTFIIFTGPVGPYYAKPVSLLAETTFVRAVAGGVGEAKTAGNYAASLLPAKLAREKGFDQIMWLDAAEFKYVQEVGTMNIFFVIDGKVVTPETDGAILKGITRKSAITILQKEGFEVEVRKVSIDELVEAYDAGKLEEAFGTGTAAVVSHVAKIQIHDRSLTLPAVEDRKVGPLVKKIIEGLRDTTIEDTYDWIVPVRELAAV
ncbi:MAG: branched-chain amino acid aminotransferase [Saprospiraceae bacterium]